MANVALLGTGLIGSGMAVGMLRRGDVVAVWNRTREKALPLAQKGARVCDSIAEAVAGAERVHIVVSDDAAVDAILDQVQTTAVIIDHSTVSPAGTKQRFTRPISFLHAPVFMSPAGARDAQGIMLCSGPEETYARVRHALEAMTGTVKYLGARPDLAAAYKLFGNAMILTICAGLSDVYRMARGLGIEPAEAHALFATFKPTSTIDVRGAKMARGDFSPSFETVMARKDLRLMEQLGSQLFVIPAVAQLLDRAIAAGHAHDDVGAITFDTTTTR